MSKELADRKAVVFGHDIVGHAIRNPALYRYVNGQTGVKVVPAGMDQQFRHLMHDRKADFWARFPFMTDDEMKVELTAHG